jgi:6,7-dimethyl-8-ribityllumazine synthase
MTDREPGTGPGTAGADVGGARNRRYAILAAAFNEPVVERLVDGARSCFDERGVPDGNVTVAWTPGAFELPLAAKAAAASGRFDAVVCLGAVIRGETSHFDFVAGEAARGIREAGMETGVPVVFGVLTTDTIQQALDRAGGDHGNKGCEAALAAMQMVTFLDQFRADRGE